MTTPLQVTIGSTHGVNLNSLISAIETDYTDANGEPVNVHIGTGSDGLPPGLLLLEPVR